LNADQLVPLALVWQNGLFSSSERLFTASGSATAPRHETDRFVLQFDHITAQVRRGLCLISQRDDAPFQLPCELKCRNCILVGPGDAPLIEQVGPESPAVLQRRLAWTGTRNIYDGFQTFWRLDDMTLLESPEELQFERWQSHWTDRENLPQVGPAGFATRLDTQRPAHAHAPGDFMLDARSVARGNASDTGDIGFHAHDLPSPEPPPLEADEE
jgi:hypothetical protein